MRPVPFGQVGVIMEVIWVVGETRAGAYARAALALDALGEPRTDHQHYRILPRRGGDAVALGTAGARHLS
jgi:hypothetical protein